MQSDKIWSNDGLYEYDLIATRREYVCMKVTSLPHAQSQLYWQFKLVLTTFLVFKIKSIGACKKNCHIKHA